MARVAPVGTGGRRIVGLAAAIAAVVGLDACGVSVEGDFQGVRWTPDGTVLAVANLHDVVERDGAIIAVARDADVQTLEIALTGALLDPRTDWRRLPTAELLEVQRRVATVDGLLLTGVPLATVEEGDKLRAAFDPTDAEGAAEGDFSFAVAAALPPELPPEDDQGLGARVSVTVTPRSLDVADDGSGGLGLDIEVKRERAAGQGGEVATGTVTLHVEATLTPERLGEANLGVIAPILSCMAASGPARAAACHDEAPLSYIDETGAVR
jgi:hypothetical protein